MRENMKTDRKVKKPTWYQRLIFAIARPIAAFHLRRKYGFVLPKREKIDGPFIFVSNHLTDNDMMFACLACKNIMYFVCSEHLFRGGLGGRLLVKAFDEIPLFKGSIAIKTTKEIMMRIKDGNSICIFPEGSRTFDGRTNPIAEATGKLIKYAGCDLVTFHLEGGYFVQPRWAKTWRRGPISGGIVKHYTKDEIAAMSVEEINEILRRDLAEDAYARQKISPKKYVGERLAEGIENILYFCPHCRSLESIRSKDDRFTCTVCHAEWIYDEFGMISEVAKETPFATVPDWSDWEDRYFDELYERESELSFSNDGVTLIEITPDHKEIPICTGTLVGDKNGLSIGDHYFPYLEMEGTEYVNLGNTFLFCLGHTYYSMTAEYLGGIKYRKLYQKCKMQEAQRTGKHFDIAK